MDSRKIRVAVGTLVGLAGREPFRTHACQDSGGVRTVGQGETKGGGKGVRTTPERDLIRLEWRECHGK